MIRFELFPVIDRMLELYELPRDINRFKAYLNILQGDNRGNLAVPVVNFNPMAKPHLISKLQLLKQLKVEDVITDTLAQLNGIDLLNLNPPAGNRTFKLAINLADDEMGGWTNRYTTDYDSKFRIQAFTARNLCVAVFWVSEVITPELVRQRTLEYAYRSIYSINHPKPLTLKDHILQEIFVARQAKATLSAKVDAYVDARYQQHQHEQVYAGTLNFLYGDEAAMQLGFKPIGIKQAMAGFNYAAALAR